MAYHKVTYARCPYCKADQPWAAHAASNQFSSGEEQTECARCGGGMVIRATEIMKFSARKLKEPVNGR